MKLIFAIKQKCLVIIRFENLYNQTKSIYMLCKQLNCLGTFDLTWNFMKYKDFQTEDFELKINSNNLVCPFY